MRQLLVVWLLFLAAVSEAQIGLPTRCYPSATPPYTCGAGTIGRCYTDTDDTLTYFCNGTINVSTGGGAAPTITDFTNAAHDHGDADDGGAIVAAALGTTMTPQLGRLGIGIAADSTIPFVSGNFTAPATGFGVVSGVATASRIHYNGAGDYGAMWVNNVGSSSTGGAGIAVGTDDNAATGSGHRLGFIDFLGGRASGGSMGVGARIECLASELWVSASDRGTTCTFQTVTTDATTLVARVTFGATEATAFSSSGAITSSSTGSLGWSIVAAADQACTTTCTNAAVFGFDGTTPVGPSDATADTCVCAGAN